MECPDPPRTEPAQHRPCLGSSRCGVQGERQDITAVWEVQGQRTGWGHPPPPHRHANTRLISEITEHLLYAGLRSKHGPSCACCRVTVTGGHLLFPFHRSASRGSEIPFVPREGLKVGLAAQGARRVTSHDPTPTSLPCPLRPPSCLHGGLASAQPTVIRAGSIPRLSCWPEARKPHPRRP